MHLAIFFKKNYFMIFDIKPAQARSLPVTNLDRVCIKNAGILQLFIPPIYIYFMWWGSLYMRQYSRSCLIIDLNLNHTELFSAPLD